MRVFNLHCYIFHSSFYGLHIICLTYHHLLCYYISCLSAEGVLFQIVCFKSFQRIVYFLTILGTNNLYSVDVPLSNKQTNQMYLAVLSSLFELQDILCIS